ncbi:MAG: hypothetical protein Q4G63_04315 [Bacteroidia bacterium]|nr:hypothetical protein [Bacteroidia bacterium]
MKKNILLFTFIGIVFLSIAAFFIAKNKKKEVVSYGRLKTFINVYNNASVNVYDSYQLELSDMCFRNDLIIEHIPENEFSVSKPFSVIYDGQFMVSDSLNGLTVNTSMKALAEKNTGAIFVYDTIHNYAHRVNMEDTVINTQFVKRFYISNEQDFSVFYIDTTLQNLPYSFNFLVDKDYNGSLVRVDTYQSDIDKFTTLKLQYTDTIPQNMYDALNRLYIESK